MNNEEKKELIKDFEPFFNVHLFINKDVDEVVSCLCFTLDNHEIKYEDNFFNLLGFGNNYLDNFEWKKFINTFFSRIIDYENTIERVQQLNNALKDTKFKSAFIDNIFYDTGEKIICLQAYLVSVTIDDKPGLFVNIIHDKGVIEDKIGLMETSKQKDLLLKEVHHRVKNNLQILNSLINLQQRFGYSDHSIIDSMKLFISSMALIHEKIYHGNDLGYVDLSSFFNQFKDLFSEMYSSFEIDFKYTIEEDLSLDVQTMIPLLLILNEECINSIKHAFPDDFEGEKEIFCHLETEGENILFTYKDNGIGLNDSDNGDSLGQILITALVKQIDGKIIIINKHEKGFISKIKFPYRKN